MRRPWFVVVGMLGACTQSSVPEDDVSVPPCAVDADCSDGICARSGECVQPSELASATVVWTIAGQTPSAQVCARATSQDLIVELVRRPEPRDGDVLAFSAPCTAGQLTIDNVPLWFWIGGVRSRTAGMWAPLDEQGVVRVDIPH